MVADVIAATDLVQRRAAGWEPKEVSGCADSSHKASAQFPSLHLYHLYVTTGGYNTGGRITGIDCTPIVR